MEAAPATGPGTPGLIALAGSGQAADRHAALVAGFDVDLVKPVSIAARRGVLEAMHGRGASGPALS